MTSARTTAAVTRLMAGPQQISRLSLACDQRPVATARRYVGAVLSRGGWNLHPDTAADAQLVVTELVTNAAQHTVNGPTHLDLALCPAGDLVVLVRDQDPGGISETAAGRLATDAYADPRAESGRGLALVHALARHDGVRIDETRRHKTVWAVLPVAPGTPDSVRSMTAALWINRFLAAPTDLTDG
ncbi:ATP-binding protein [Actinacidiphila sp. DG2A-62]|uniref:ATP-binding protein n=1 Tax=Actinacidiphila sp. DG2A-62 TaxID=3108821 RepID=UPI002DB7BF78|nr:ATP-binding protein [Actinacidiphila sp. DG2A-62]MEC3997226.1 ATP-binding protein [Actinacidiphila sp. DG2A-62]